MSQYRKIKAATAEVVGVRVVRKSSTAKAHEAIRDIIVASPALSYQQIAQLLGCSRWLVTRSRRSSMSGGRGALPRHGSRKQGNQSWRTCNDGEELGTKLFRVLRQSGTEGPLTDAQVRKLTGLDQMDIDIAAEQLEAEGMVVIESTYMLVED